MKVIYITGGSGYIGTNLTLYLLHQGFRVVSIDKVPQSQSFKSRLESENLFKYWDEFIVDLTEITPEEYFKINKFTRGDENYAFMHLAGWKDLNASLESPLEYYRNNLISAIKSVELASVLATGVFIFSSTAAIYPDSSKGSVKESDIDYWPSSPYGNSKFILERVLWESCTHVGITCVSLRYQNPIGSYKKARVDHSDSMFGNLLNHINDEKFEIFGNNYPTPDGTCIRDYVPMIDLCKVHLDFAKLIIDSKSEVDRVYNVGTGKGISCKEVVDLVKSIKPDFKYFIGAPREGDAAGSWADTTKLNELGIYCNTPLKEEIKNLLNL